MPRMHDVFLQRYVCVKRPSDFEYRLIRQLLREPGTLCSFLFSAQ